MHGLKLSAQKLSMGSEFVTEVPSSLKQLARLVVRGFYKIEDALIIDMLVRNPCMKEDDICELLKFERKMLRARIDTLKNDKFIQTKMKMETGPDGKAQRQNYYYINYKIFVNVVKYKLDHMRRKMETEERNATSRSSFKCPSCEKTYTDLQADQLFDPATGEFLCTFCNTAVEEDEAAMPRQDSRMMLARFNEVMEQLFVLLREVEGIKLAPEILEPEPIDIQDILHRDDRKKARRDGPAGADGIWSGEATRNAGFNDETTVNINMEEEGAAAPESTRKERPVWMMESTVITEDADATETAADTEAAGAGGDERGRDDIMSVLLQHETRESRRPVVPGQDSSDESEPEVVAPPAAKPVAEASDVEEFMDSDDDDTSPTVQVGAERIAISDVTDDVIARMTADEKEAYILAYQDYYSHIHE
ncbi:general transcription factor IIE subunit 1-like isoform X4 [Amphibalanus amphitrite]|uniref:general transcription factor IIE subunit 1-like isoform X4 n=1 Tax=Amphibalanus amphitrite TaxID=1232801 RepID=UPI001C905983|nr:general transcription factor IIE subunit 1-like isoform X4 [Amphibalanus amphitrite]